MIVRNYLETEGKLEPAHGGKGLVKNVCLFAQDDLDTSLRFITYCEIGPGASIGYHQHGENEEVYAVLEGRGLMTVNDESRQVKTGDVILNKPGWSHGLENNGQEPLKILVFEVQRD